MVAPTEALRFNEAEAQLAEEGCLRQTRGPCDLVLNSGEQDWAGFTTVIWAWNDVVPVGNQEQAPARDGERCRARALPSLPKIQLRMFDTGYLFHP